MAIAIEASTLAITAALHLAGGMPDEPKRFSGTSAGIAETIIGLVMAFAAGELFRRSEGARSLALGATIFAIVGFLIGLSFTIRSGAPIDLAYHATMLPILVATTLALSRLQEPGPRPPAPREPY